jgi:uncharacterized membrane protein YdbT with pleckstrin-like domain
MVALIMDLHPDERVVLEGHPSWRSTLGFYTIGLVIAIAVGAGLGFGVSGIGGVGGGVVVFLIVLAVGYVKRMTTTYMVSTQRLYIRRGILAKHVQQTRIDRVQNVNTNQALWQRLMAIGTVDFDTAGTDDSEFKFVGIARPQKVVDAVDLAQHAAATGDPSTVRSPIRP